MYRMVGRENDIVEMEFVGPIERGDLDEMARDLGRLVADEGRLRILCRMPDAEGWADVESLVHDLKLDLRFNPHIDRFAVVGDARWLEWLTKLMKPFAHGEVRHFNQRDLTTARAWVAA